MICRICRDHIEEDHPETVYTWNPETNRRAIMHYWCALHAYEHLTQEQKEKYLQLDEGLKNYSVMVIFLLCSRNYSNLS